MGEGEGRMIWENNIETCILSNVKSIHFFAFTCFYLQGSQVVLVVKNPPANAGDVRNLGSIPGSGRSPGEGNGNPLQYSCLENAMDRGACWATVYGVAQSQTWLSLPHVFHFQLGKERESWFYTHTHTHTHTHPVRVRARGRKREDIFVF